MTQKVLMNSILVGRRGCVVTSSPLQHAVNLNLFFFGIAVIFAVSPHTNVRQYSFVPVPAARSSVPDRYHHSFPFFSHSPHHVVLDDWLDSLVVLRSSSLSPYKIGMD